MKKIISCFLVFILTFQLLSYNCFVLADERSQLKEQIEQTQSQIEEEKEKLDEITAEKTSVKEQVEEISNQIYSYENEIDLLEKKISELQEQIQQTQEEIEQKEIEYQETSDLLDERLVLSYQRGNLTYLDVILSSKSLTEIVNNYYLVEQIVEADNKLMDEIVEQKQEIEQEKQLLEESKAEQENSKAELEVKKTALDSAKAEKNKYISQLTEDEQAQQEKIDQLEADNRAINAQLEAAEKAYAAKIAQMQAEAAAKKQQTVSTSNSSSSSTTSSSSSSASSGSGILIPPVNGTITTTMYYSSGKYHGALDYGVPIGTTVKAAADGVVLSVQSLSTSYGNFVVIRHANGLRTWYAHGNGVFYVSAGDTVTQGQAIMQSGNSGNSSRPHLHFEVRVSPYNYSSSGNDSRVDPRNYF